MPLEEVRPGFEVKLCRGSHSSGLALVLPPRALRNPQAHSASLLLNSH